MNFEEPKSEGMPRREFIQKLSAFVGIAVISPKVLAEAGKENIEQNRTIKNAEMIVMPDKGNLRDGFSRMKINLEFEGGDGKIEGAGSFFSLEDTNQAKTEFLSKNKHPDLFKQGVDFDAIETYYKNQGKEVTLVVAGAYYAGNTKNIEGVALENGETVGEAGDMPKSGLNGLLVIENNIPRIEYVNQIQNFGGFVQDLKTKKADLFQQTSYLRPGGQFSSSKADKWELRFFIEADVAGVAKKGVLNFSIDMTYTEAVEAMQKMKGITITKAIGLDTGNMSEGYFYDKAGKEYLMIDEDVGKHREEYTNVLVFFSE